MGTNKFLRYFYLSLGLIILIPSILLLLSNLYKIITYEKVNARYVESISHYPVFEFEYRSKIYKVKNNMGSKEPEYKEYELVELYINPDNPNKFLLKDFMNIFIFSIFGLSFGGFIMLGYIFTLPDIPISEVKKVKPKPVEQSRSSY